MKEKYEQAKEILNKYKQEHLLIWYDKLLEQKKEELLDQILNINFEQIKDLYNETQRKKDFKDCKIEPLSYIDKDKLTIEETKEYETLGEDIIKSEKYAVVTMAGGQGTRLRTQRSQRNI